MIYVPDLENYKCFVVQNEGVVRAYEQVPRNNASIDYRDYYVNSSYIFKDGTQNFTQYQTLPVCLEQANLTSNFYYRNDFSDILTIFFIIVVFAYFIVSKFIKVFFFGFRYV